METPYGVAAVCYALQWLPGTGDDAAAVGDDILGLMQSLDLDAALGPLGRSALVGPIWWHDSVQHRCSYVLTGLCHVFNVALTHDAAEAPSAFHPFGDGYCHADARLVLFRLHSCMRSLLSAVEQPLLEAHVAA